MSKSHIQKVLGGGRAVSTSHEQELLSEQAHLRADPYCQEVRREVICDGVDYLVRGGILKTLLLESFQAEDTIRLFYVLNYIHGMYLMAYPDGTPDMPDDDYTLFSKVEGELTQVVPKLLEILKDTYEAWLLKEVLGFGGASFTAGMLVQPENSSGQNERLYYLWRPKREHPRPPDRFEVPGFVESLKWARTKGMSEEDHAEIQAVLYEKYRVRSKVLEYNVVEIVVERDVARGMHVQVGARLYWAKSKRPSLPLKYFDGDASLIFGTAMFEQYFGEVNLQTILRWTPAVQMMHKMGEPEVTEQVTRQVIKFYQKFIQSATSNWRYNIGNISALLNLVHNTGSMAEYVGSKDVLTTRYGVTTSFLKKMSDLDEYVPSGTDHKTLRTIYNRWQSF